MPVKQTAGRDRLGEFAPEFARLNDDVLFGEVWSREGALPLKLRSIVTVSALIGKGITDSSLRHHLEFARANGVSRSEMAEPSPTSPSTRGGPTPGRPSPWRQRSTTRPGLRSPDTVASSAWASRTTGMRSTSVAARG